MNKKISLLVLSFLFVFLLASFVVGLGSVALNAPANLGYYNGNITLNATTDTEAYNITFMFYNATGDAYLNHTIANGTADNVSFVNITFDTLALLPDGVYNITINATNATGILAGNVTVANITIDNTAPIVSLSNMSANFTWTSDTTPSFNFTYTDDISPNASCVLYIDNVAYYTNISTTNNTNTTMTVNTTNLTSGTYTWTVNCTDLAGNVGAGDINNTFFVGTPTLSSPANDTWTTGRAVNGVNFTFNVTSGVANASSCTLYIKNTSGNYVPHGINATTVNNTPTTILNNVTLNPGPNNWLVNCSYNASVITSESRRLNVDNTTAKMVYIGKDPLNWTWTVDTTPSFNFSFVDNTSANASCTLYLNNVAYGTNASVQNDSNTSITTNASLSIGKYLWNISCSDLAGNIRNSTTTNIIDIVERPTLLSPINWTYHNQTAANGMDFVYRFTSNIANASACILYVSNKTGHFVPIGGANSTKWNTTINNTQTTLQNNASFYNNSVNWTINCSFNGVVISSLYNTLNVDNMTPTVTATTSAVTSSSATIAVTTPETANCRYGQDSVWGNMITFSTTGATAHSTSVSGLDASTGYTYFIRCRDLAANEVLGSTSFTTSSSGGSGGTGSSGGTTASSVGQYAKETWSSINAGETATVGVTNGAIGVTEVSFVVENTAYGAWVKVAKVTSLPSSVESFSGKTYRNIKITEMNVEKALKEAATIDFKVEKTWLSENSLSKSNVALFRYVDGEWTELATTVGEDDGTYVHYSAQTPGFSYFVIGQKAGVSAVEAVAETVGEAAEAAVPTEVAEEPQVEGSAPAVGEEEVSEASIWPWIITIVVIIALGAIIYWLKQRK